MRVERPYRITALGRGLRVGLGILLMVSIVGSLGGDLFAQTSYSLRIRSIGTSFAGIIDDPHTDAYLNPACVGDLRDRQIYMARLPGARLEFCYPDNAGIDYYNRMVLPDETVPGNPRWGKWYELYTPYTFGLVKPLSRSTKLSLSLNAAADGYDRLDSWDELRIMTDTPVENKISTYSDADGYDRNLYHVVADVAIGTGNPESGGTRTGVRARVGYDQMQNGGADVYQQIRTGYPEINEMNLDYRYGREQRSYERITAELSFGLYRNSGFFAQAVLGGGWKSETLTGNEFSRRINDDDYDGNGVDRYGDETPLYEVRDAEYNASRSYDGVYSFGRLGLNWSDRVRSFHGISWGESNGSGDGITTHDYSGNSVLTEEQYIAVLYNLDGNTTRFVTDHSVGYVHAISDNFQIAIGVRAHIQYEKFEEDGAGEGSLTIFDDILSDTYDTPYSQVATYNLEYWLLDLPMGFEWDLHRNITWRFGTTVRTTRLDDMGELNRDIGILDDQSLDENISFRDAYQRIDYDSELYFNMGFGLTFRDKLSIDLLSAVTTSSFNAANIATAQLNYYF